MIETWYEAKPYWAGPGCTIKAVEVERSTAFSVWIGGKRRKIARRYFKTWFEAKEHLMAQAALELSRGRRILEKAQGKYANIKGLREQSQ